MKKSKKLLACLMGATILATSLFGGCGGAGYAAGATEGAPDYSQSENKFVTWSMGAVMGDWVMLNGERYYELPNRPAGFFQTRERTQDLKDCNFTMVSVDWSIDKGDYKFFETMLESPGHKVIKDCEELGMSVLLDGGLFRSYTMRTESNFNPERYATAEERVRANKITEYKIAYSENSEELREELKTANPTLDDAAIDALLQEKITEKATKEVEENIEVLTFQYGESDGQYFKDQDHMTRIFKFVLDPILEEYPNVVGVTLVDEPNWKMFPAIREVLISLHAYNPDLYTMLNLLPMTTSGSIHNSYCDGGANMGMVPAYKEYLRQYHEYFGGYIDYIMYDDYPILYSGLLTSFMQCHEIVADFAKEHGYERRIVMQTYDDGNKRTPKLPDMLFQANVAMAFGCTDFSNYVYLPHVNSNGADFPNQEENAMRWDGTKTNLWYALQDMNEELLYYGKTLSNFKFVESTYYRTDMTAPTGWNYTMGMTQGNMTKLSDCSFKMLKDMGGMILITEMYDEANDQWGYCVVNATDPGVSSEVEVTLTFNDYKNVQIVQSLNTTNLALKDNKITVQIGSGRSAFVMPY
ncbi:MAG: hypothetical protein IJC72_01815 [Clostridia bacterium]|nr:hypothetical protein [Clostridia bacterium]